MKKTIFLILSLSICLSSEGIPGGTANLIKSLQDKYRIYTPEDLNKFKSHPNSRTHSNFIRDMNNLVGQWYLEADNLGLFVTVGTDQSIPNMLSLMGMDTANGGISVTHNDYETELNYLVVGSLMNGDDDDGDAPINDNDDNPSRNAGALDYAQDFVNDSSGQYNQLAFDLVTEFDLTIDGDNVSGGLGGTNPSNCEINWPQDPYKAAIYSFVSEYVLAEGGSVGCFVYNPNLDQTYADIALEMESGWTGDDDDDDDDDNDSYSYGPRIGAYLTDLDPSGGGVYFDETDTEATITFVDVPLFDNSSALNTFQIQLLYGTNEVVITYKDLFLTGGNTFEAAGGLAIGISDGNGQFTDVDLSESSGEYYSVPVEGFSSSNDLDMNYKKITFKPNDDFSEYSVSSETVTDLEGEYSNEIIVEDDDYATQVLSSEFIFYGTVWNQIYINNDGNIGFEDGDDTCVCSECDDGDGQCAAAYLAGGSGGSGGGDDSDDPDFIIMNFDFWNLFTFLFGFPLDGVDNPLLVTISLEDEIVVAQGLTGFGQDPDMYIGGQDFSNFVSVDMDESTIIFNSLDLYDSTGTAVLSLDGTISPGMIDLVAGVETELPFFPDDMIETDTEYIYMNLFEDSTGSEVVISEDYYYQEITDTTEFYWYASGDTLYRISLDDYIYYPEGGWESVLYQLSDDTLIISAEDHPCDEYNYYYDTMDDCVEMVADSLPMVAGLEDVSELYMYIERIMTRLPTVSIISGSEILPKNFALYQAYPNPFNPVTSIAYELPKDEMVHIAIYDIMGRKVRTLIPSKDQLAGYHRVTWNAKNDLGQPMAAGMYIYTIQAGEFRQSKKMLLLK